MKKLFPIAFLLCAFFSLSSFAPVRSDAPVIKKSARRYSFPITGTTDGTPGAGQPAGTIAYEVNGSGTIPSSITFKTLSGTVLGTYAFSLSSPNNYLAGGMKAQTSISGVYFHISSACGTGYCLEFIGGI
ncbi:hypothetical protein [Chitinophaga ginsengisoli]|uniref:Uncharacterized protein n=1 Tax=Chitinophaga ginsengisoli TaxID=363837 RepID=A0A2P8FNR9_9BACT|nr:hypothetical protein [Chitinophaga ginsengisoli]PSL23368.1 hypothetical protein CLV42_11885 [Chitinophaga ginsengisoli]